MQNMAAYWVNNEERTQQNLSPLVLGSQNCAPVSFLFCEECCASDSPGADQVLSQADAGVRASDGDMSVSGALHRVGNLDLSPWHLTDLIDLCTLAANDAANELKEGKEWGNRKIYKQHET